MTDSHVIIADLRTYPRCAECNRAVMYQFYGNFAEHCYLHATDEEIWARNQAYTRKIQEALVQAEMNHSCNCNGFNRDSCPRCRPEPWDRETELEF